MHEIEIFTTDICVRSLMESCGVGLHPPEGNLPVLRISPRPACVRRSGELSSPAAARCYNSCAVLLIAYTTKQ